MRKAANEIQWLEGSKLSKNKSEKDRSSSKSRKTKEFGTTIYRLQAVLPAFCIR